MLLEINSIKPNDIVSIKIISGDEILAKVIEITDKGIKISKPLQLVIMNQGQVGMLPFMIGTDDDNKMFLSNDKIILMGKARADAAGQYIENTTGIKVPGKSSLKI